jgi:hypothetical protein
MTAFHLVMRLLLRQDLPVVCVFTCRMAKKEYLRLDTMIESGKAFASAGQRRTEQKIRSDVLQICNYSATGADGLQSQSWMSSEMLGSAISTLKVFAA